MYVYESTCQDIVEVSRSSPKPTNSGPLLSTGSQRMILQPERWIRRRRIFGVSTRWQPSSWLGSTGNAHFFVTWNPSQAAVFAGFLFLPLEFMPLDSNEEDLLASLQFVSRSIEDASLTSLDDDEEPLLLLQELVPLLQPLVRFMKKREVDQNEDSPATIGATITLEDLGSAQDCREQAADVLSEIQAMVASEIQTWGKHLAYCSTFEQAGVSRAEECRQMEKEILQEYKKLQRQVESCFHGIRVKTDGKLLSPNEKQMALWLDKIQDLETRLKEKEDRERALDGEVESLRKTLGQRNFLEKVGAFGACAWNKYFGNVGEEPPLPSIVAETMESPCPFWCEKKIRETHLLVLIPSTVNGRPFSLDLLDTLIQNPKDGGNKTCYRVYNKRVKNQIGNRTVERSYWILITREILPDSLNKEYKAQETLLAPYNQTTRRPDMDYKFPGALEAATAVLTNYVRSGEVLLGSDVWARGNDLLGVTCRSLVGGVASIHGLKVSCTTSFMALRATGVLACCSWKQD